MTEKIKGFDGIRGVAVIFVVLTHLGVWTSLEKKGQLSHSMTTLVHGGAGVQAFFILSGFLITLLLIHEHEQYSKISVKNFIVRRTLRIFPLYILFLLIVTCLHIFGKNVTTWQSLYYAYLYIYNFVPKSVYTAFMGHTWSLAVEEHFYLVWPFLFYYAYPKYKNIILVLLVVFIMQAIVNQYYFLSGSLAKHYFIARWSFIGGYPIALGCLMAILFKTDKYKILKSIMSKPLFLFAGLMLYSNALYISYNFQNIYDVAINGDIRTVGMLCILMWILTNQNSIFIKILELKPLQYIGKISYGIYMYQGLFLSTGPTRIIGQSWPPEQSVGLALLMITAPLSYHYFEKPFLKLKGRFR